MAHLAARLTYATKHSLGPSVIRRVVAASAVPPMLMVAVTASSLRPDRTSHRHHTHEERYDRTTHPDPRSREAERYEIRLAGHLDAHWAAWFDGLTVTRNDDGTTDISGLIVDQAAFHGLLQRVRDLGLPLVSVTRIDHDDSPRNRRTTA